MRWTSLLAGAIGLALLDAFLTNRAAAANVGGAETTLAKLIGKFLDPAVPAFSSSSSKSSKSSSKPARASAAQPQNVRTRPLALTG